MTTYAFDGTTSQLTAVWDTGAGATSRIVARLHARTLEEQGLHLARALTTVSAAVWLSYTDPVVVQVPAAAALRALRRPHLPQTGLLYREDDLVLESAHGVGRELAAVGSAGVTRAVVTDVADELDAVERAGRGDLTGRARQAVMLTRLDASPVQIAAADRLLHDVPMGSERLFTEVEPTAAAVAAVHWLQAAADVTAAVAGWEPAQVIDEAATIEHLDREVPGAVLDLVGVGNAPLAVVQNLVRTAVLAGRGMVLAGAGPADESDEPHVTVLDPARPARCLLEGVVRGIQGCFLVYAERLDPAEVGPGLDDPEWTDAARERFDAVVRVEAGRTAHRLG